MGMIFSPIALLVVPFTPLPLHATQAGPQETLQICVLLLQVASLSALYKVVSDIILTTSWCLRHRFDDILMYPPLFWSHFHFLTTCFMIFLKMCSLP